MNEQPEAQYYAHFRDERSPDEKSAADALVNALIALAEDEAEAGLSEGWIMSLRMHEFAEAHGPVALASVLIDFAHLYSADAA